LSSETSLRQSMLSDLSALHAIAAGLRNEVIARYPGGSDTALDFSERTSRVSSAQEMASGLADVPEGEPPLLPVLQSAASYALSLHELVVEAARVTGRRESDEPILRAAAHWTSFNAAHRALIASHPGTRLAFTGPA
jgi:hypothetical protein